MRCVEPAHRAEWTAPPARDVVAKIEIRAESQAELNKILLSLDNALHQFQPRTSRAEASRTHSHDAAAVSSEMRLLTR
jgi:hypothetical protein